MTAVKIADAKFSETFSTIAKIAGQKAHNVTAKTLLEDAEAEVFVRMGFRAGGQGWGEITKTAVLPAGTTIYLWTNCGTVRSATGWKVYRNSYTPADAVTCSKCLKH